MLAAATPTSKIIGGGGGEGGLVPTGSPLPTPMIV